MCKFIVVCGGVISGIGKGVASASMALLMRQRGHNVQLVKFDPYLNVDAGILSPSEHGETMVCDDGSEVDLDLGHYERIGGITTSRMNIYTAGSIYKDLIHEQEHGKFLGQTIQIIPHVTQKIIDRVEDLGRESDIVFIEIGGTIGDIESAQFYEAMRILRNKDKHNGLVVLVAPILWVPTISEFKTKPLQRAVLDLNSHNLQPDIILCRTEAGRELPQSILKKVANLTNVNEQAVIEAPDVKTIYEVPLEFHNRNVDSIVADLLHLPRKSCNIYAFRKLVNKSKSTNASVNIAVFGKYNNATEAYISLREALFHAGVANDVEVNINWVSSEDLEKVDNVSEWFKDINGIIVPGGFDMRGIEGKIKAIQYAREHNIPFLGICLGLQCAVIEFARNVCSLEGANSIEFNPKTEHPVIHYVEGQEGMSKKAATMRLGSYDCKLLDDTLSKKIYSKRNIKERHRHRFEVNNKYVEILSERGLVVAGINPDTNLIEMMELNGHPYFIGTQAHPEFKSRLVSPAPLFVGLISAAKSHG